MNAFMSFEPTYEELKQDPEIEIIGQAVNGKVLSLPMRN